LINANIVYNLILEFFDRCCCEGAACQASEEAATTTGQPSSQTGREAARTAKESNSKLVQQYDCDWRPCFY